MNVSSIANPGASAANASIKTAAVQQKDSPKAEPAARNSPAPTPANAQRTVSNTEFNTDAGRVVFQLVHPLSEAVIAQFPSEIQLKVGEYVSSQGNSTPTASLTLQA